MTSNYKNLKKQISYIAIYKFLIIGLNFLLISLLIKYLGTDNFGIYIALTSLFSWMFLFDLGIAKGMRNYVTIAISNNKFKEAKEYISSTFISIFFIAIIFGISSILIILNLNISNFLNLNIDNNYLQNLFIILIIGFFLKFYFSIVDQLNFATHNSQKVTLNLFLVSFFNSTGIFLLLTFDNSRNITYTIFVFSLSTVIPYIYMTFDFFKSRSELLPSFTSFNNKKLKRILAKGFKILFVQICFLLVIGLDRLILLKYGSATEVTKYEIIYKVMSFVIVPVSIFTSPLWSAFTDAYNNKDILWIKIIFKKFYISIFLLIGIILFLTYQFNNITYFWLDNFPVIEHFSLLLMGLLVLSLIWNNFHTDFLLSIQNFYFTIKLITFGLLSKFIFIFYILSYSNTVSLIEIVLSSILAYLFYNISVPFYIKKVLQKRDTNE